jgi:integrase
VRNLKSLSETKTVMAIKAFKGPGRLNIGDGLYMLVTPQGYRRWQFRYSYAGKQRELALGTDSDISLALARKAASEARDTLYQGMNPADTMSVAAKRMEQRVKAGIPTFEEAAKAYIDLLDPTFKNKKARQPWELALVTYAKPLAKMPLNAITSKDVAKVLQPIWNSKRETSRRVRWRIEKVFGVAIVNGYRQHDPQGNIIQQRNPAAWKDNLDHLMPMHAAKLRVQPKHHAAMPYNKVPGFLRELEAKEALAAMALRFCILTATRTSETLAATWEEIDLETGLWTIPASRMKAGREHVVPLCPAALAILKSLPRFVINNHVFAGKSKKPMSNMSMAMLLRRMGQDEITVHGFRSSFRDWVAEETDFPNEVAEAALAHVIESKTERAYRRGDLLEKRKLLMQAWGTYCARGVA